MLNLPVVGPVLRKIAVARFTRTLGTLITSGVPILEGLAITARTSGNAVLEQALMKVRKSVEEGRTIVDPLKESGVFPNMVTQMIGVGEATGAMDAMLQKIADFYEDEVDSATKNMLTLLEPIMIGFLGVVVGGIVISLYFAAVLHDCQVVRLKRFFHKYWQTEAAGKQAGMEETRFNEGTWLAWLVKVRVIIISFLLAVELLIVNFTTTNVPIHLFLTAVLVWYTVSVFFIVLASLWQDHKLQAITQIFTDLVFVTVVVYVTGGIDTFFNFLYTLVIIVASVLLPRYWAYLTAAVSFILFGALLELCFFERLPTFQTSARTDSNYLLLVLLVNLSVYMAVAHLSSMLVSKLRQAEENSRTRGENCSACRLCTRMWSIPSGPASSLPTWRAALPW